MGRFEVSALMKVREGQLEGFKRQAAEVIRVSGEKDTRTLRYDWYLSEDRTACEAREDYVDSDGWFEHRLNIDEALAKLFSDFAEGHAAYGYGDASEELVKYGEERMPPGSLRWYRFLDGLAKGAEPQQVIAQPAGSPEATPRAIEVSVRAKVREGQLAGLEKQAARCVQATRENDTKTIRYDWYVTRDGTMCETREAYLDGDGLIEHRVKNVEQATNEMFLRFAEDPVVTVYGEVPPELREFVNERMGDAVHWYSFYRGLDT